MRNQLTPRAAAMKARKTYRPTPAEIIEFNLENIRNAHPALVGLMRDRAEGALEAMCNLGLINGDTYLKASRDAFYLARSREVRHA